MYSLVQMYRRFRGFCSAESQILCLSRWTQWMIWLEPCLSCSGQVGWTAGLRARFHSVAVFLVSLFSHLRCKLHPLKGATTPLMAAMEAMKPIVQTMPQQWMWLTIVVPHCARKCQSLHATKITAGQLSPGKPSTPAWSWPSGVPMRADVPFSMNLLHKHVTSLARIVAPSHLPCMTSAFLHSWQLQWTSTTPLVPVRGLQMTSKMCAVPRPCLTAANVMVEKVMIVRQIVATGTSAIAGNWEVFRESQMSVRVKQRSCAGTVHQTTVIRCPAPVSIIVLVRSVERTSTAQPTFVSLREWLAH